MPRPVGAPFVGERLPQDDEAILAGSPTTVGSGFDYAVQKYTDSKYLSMTSGDSYLVIAAREDTYLETGDTGLEMSWFLRIRGTGTIDVRDDSNFDWDYTLPANALDTINVSSSDWTEINVPTTNLNVTEILGWYGQRFSITVTSGSVDISQVALQIYPVGGALGWFATRGGYTETTSSTAAFRLRVYSSSYGYPDSGWETTPEPAWDGVMAEILEPGGDDGSTGNVVGLAQSAAPDFQAIAGQALAVGDFAFPTGKYTATANLGAAVMTAKGASPTKPNPSNGGAVDGTDYVRRPDRTTYDADAYIVSGGFMTNLWQSPNLWVQNGFDPSEDDDFGASIDVGTIEVTSSSYEDLNANTVPYPDWTSGGGVASFDRGSTGDSVVSISPESEGMTIHVWASALEDAADYDGVGGSIQTTAVAFITGTITDPDDPGFQYLQYVRSWGAFVVWDPYGVRGGKLKLRLPSDEWRIIGDEAGSDTERLKLQTPDLTWWQEYRAVDGDVPTHPLKLYTADGWVVVARMTPD